MKRLAITMRILEMWKYITHGVPVRSSSAVSIVNTIYHNCVLTNVRVASLILRLLMSYIYIYIYIYIYTYIHIYIWSTYS